LVEWKQEPESKVWINPSIVAGEHLVTECPYIYREFIERKYA
jgi:hypothetical protein